MLKPIFLSLFLFLTWSLDLYAQKDTFHKSDVIQFTGKVITADENGDIVPLPYVNIGVVGTSRGAVSEWDGYFSFVAIKGETVRFSRVGYKTVNFVIPDTLNTDFYSWIQIMSRDSILLDEVIIFPWPDRDFFKQEFLAIDISDELRAKAEENLAEEVMSEMRYSVPADGKEATSYDIRHHAAQFRYSGQYKPQKIFDVVAWKQFIEAWKRGDFKRKKKKK